MSTKKEPKVYIISIPVDEENYRFFVMSKWHAQKLETGDLDEAKAKLQELRKQG